MNLCNRLPYQKAEPVSARPDYLAAVRELPCCICKAFGMVQTSPTQAHHPICGRHGSRKVPDIMAIPLCEGCHQGLLDTSKIAIHRERVAWVQAYGPDTDYTAATQDMLAYFMEDMN